MIAKDARATKRTLYGQRPGVRLAAGFIALASVASACGAQGATVVEPAIAQDPVPTCEAAPTATERVEASPRSPGPSALDDRSSPAFPTPLVDLDDIRSGGPPPDGIPSIDAPLFLPVCAVDFLADNEPVVVLTIGDETRAYPIQILTWHEIVNDVVSGTPVSVSFCPLCNSALAFDRRLGDQILDFGTSGSLFRSNLVMYDRQTESLWIQFTGEAVVGTLTGTTLEVIPMSTVSWSDFRDAKPEALVLSQQTGFTKSYGRNPYPGYDDVNTDAFLFDGELDERLQAKTRIVGIRRDGDAVAILRDLLLEELVLEVEIGAGVVVVFAKSGTASALDAAEVADGRDVGAIGVFDPVLDGRPLSFEAVEDEFVDTQTGSKWNILGEAVEGELAGQTLRAIEHDNSFWFAWGTFEPDSRIIR